MTARCCSAPILPAAALLLLPKCPLCLAAWLTLATGIGFSAAAASWLRAAIVLLSFAALGVILWRRSTKPA
jgi:hypothetical protein